MPGLYRKLLICAGAQGLLLQPVNSKNQPSGSSGVLIEYKTNAISPSLHQSAQEHKGTQIEAFGIVGLLNLATTSYLISISKRAQVAQIRGKPIYVVSDVTLIPLSSQEEAVRAIAQAGKASATAAAKAAKQQHEDDTDLEDDDASSNATYEEDDAESHHTHADPVTPGITTENQGRLGSPSSVVKDVIKDQGKYGRFADKWFSKGGWSASGRRNIGMSSEDDLSRGKEVAKSPAEDALNPSAAEKDAMGAEAKKDKAAEPGQEGSSDQVVKEKDSVLESLTPRILRTTKLFFASRSFYYSYDHDLSKSLARQSAETSGLPLYKQFDPVYFWNKSLIAPFINAGQQGLVIPLIQGFVGQRAFTIGKTVTDDKAKVLDATEEEDQVIQAQQPAAESGKDQADPAASAETGPDLNAARSEDFLLTLISRRSTKRAGLRYLRRGIDDDGNVANYVESEQILSRPTWDPTEKVASFVQIRGSIPVFFSQSPYSFKPVPVAHGSEATNHAAFEKHFASVIDRYGDVQVASLVDKHGNELAIGKLYEHHAELTNSAKSGSSSQSLASRGIDFEWFDFHTECKGMKFENVQILLDTLGPFLTRTGWTTQEHDKIIQSQSGVLRTNCMDCLDRTNVTQSAVAGDILTLQLKEQGLEIDLHTDPKTSWFNTLWADNGDAISKQYAGTAALKGDYTRTRKRNWTGALSDFSLTLTRYYNNIFGDYFLQTCIDYWLGNVDKGVWEVFESDLMSGDYAMDVRGIRQGAIDMCAKVILGADTEQKAQSNHSDKINRRATPVNPEADDNRANQEDEEDLIAGWTLATPHEANTLKSLPLEECVFLLTERALYLCRFDWQTEKVGAFESVDLADIQSVKWGAYITSSLGETHLDETKNVGFVVSFAVDKDIGAVVRRNTRALGNEVTVDDDNDNDNDGTKRSGDQEVESEDHRSGATDQEITEGKDQKDKSAANIKKQKGEVVDTKTKDTETRILAFKALPPRSYASKEKGEHGSELSQVQLIRHVCEEIERLAKRKAKHSDNDSASATGGAATDGAATGGSVPSGGSGGLGWEVEHKDIISVAEAKKSTGLLESIGYSLKKLVWA